jgi:hypothetical protein
MDRRIVIKKKGEEDKIIANKNVKKPHHRP